MKNILLILVSILALLFIAGSTTSADEGYKIRWWTIDSGGGASNGGDYTLRDTIGQYDASPSISGGVYTLKGGFWGDWIISEPPPIPITGGINIYLPMIGR